MGSISNLVDMLYIICIFMPFFSSLSCKNNDIIVLFVLDMSSWDNPVCNFVY